LVEGQRNMFLSSPSQKKKEKNHSSTQNKTR